MLNEELHSIGVQLRTIGNTMIQLAYGQGKQEDEKPTNVEDVFKQAMADRNAQAAQPEAPFAWQAEGETQQHFEDRVTDQAREERVNESIVRAASAREQARYREDSMRSTALHVAAQVYPAIKNEVSFTQLCSDFYKFLANL